MGSWQPGPGVLVLPSGRLVRGRSVRAALPPEGPPEFGVYLLGAPPTMCWPHRWVRCPDFGVPVDREEFRGALVEALERADADRVEIGCGGGRGRTGTALACLAVLDDLDGAAAVDFVRTGYDPHAVETP